MKLALTDGSGRWFDDKTAVVFSERTRWDGNNHISVATGSQWDHEALYYTQGGRWVKKSWSQRQGTLEDYLEVDEEEAVRWLVVNNCFRDKSFEELPEELCRRLESQLDQAEL